MLNHPAPVRVIPLRAPTAQCTRGLFSLVTLYRTHLPDTTMDAERINLIGNTLSDLTVRTQELRRYL